MRMGRWLVWLAGGRDDVLRRTTADRTRYVATGGVLLTTAAVAAASATFALLMAVQLPLVACVIVGIGWGVVILNLDRLLITSMVRHRTGGWWRNTLMAIPRVALALLLGAVISTPLVLQIFDREIQSQLLVLQRNRQAAFEDSLKNDPRFTIIPGLEQQLKDLQAAANGSVAQNVDADPAVKTARAEVARRLDTLTNAQAELQAELDGTGGTRTPGVGAASRAKQAAVDTAQARFDQANDALRQAIASAQAASVGTADTARDKIKGVQDQLDAAKAAQDRARADYAVSQKDSGGLLSRLEALDALRVDRPTLGTAQFLLFLLFMTLELLPVIVKLLQIVGPESVYDTMIRELETDALSQAAVQRARDRERADLESERRLDLDLDWAEKQYQEGLRANAQVMNKQRSIVDRAITDWADHSTTTEDEAGIRETIGVRPVSAGDPGNEAEQRTVRLP